MTRAALAKEINVDDSGGLDLKGQILEGSKLDPTVVNLKLDDDLRSIFQADKFETGSQEWVVEGQTVASDDFNSWDDEWSEWIPFREGGIQYRGQLQKPDWLGEVISDLRKISTLEQNWDSYGGRPISHKAILKATEILSLCIANDTPAPWVVATSLGGIQFEWHTEGEDLEIEIDAQGRLLECRESDDGVNLQQFLNKKRAA
jgi:hypothetical protein